MALGWKERFASTLAFFILDVGIGKPKQPPPPAVLRARVGRNNDAINLPELPVRPPTHLDTAPPIQLMRVPIDVLSTSATSQDAVAHARSSVVSGQG